MRFADLNTTTDYYHGKRSYEWENYFGGGERIRPVSLNRYRKDGTADPGGQYVKVVYLDRETGEPDARLRVPEGYVRLSAIRDTWAGAQELLARARANRERARESRIERSRKADTLEASVRDLASDVGLALGFAENSDDPRFLSFKVRATDLKSFLKTVERERWQAAQDRVNAAVGAVPPLPRLPSADQVRNLTAKEAADLAATLNDPTAVRLASDEPREVRRPGKRVVRHSGGEGNSQG